MIEASQQPDRPVQFYPNQTLEVCFDNCFDDLGACPEEWRYVPVNDNKVPWNYETNRALEWDARKEFKGYTAKQIQQIQPKRSF